MSEDEMTLEELNRAIAEARGWEQYSSWKRREHKYVFTATTVILDRAWITKAYEIKEVLPAWTTDPAAALKLAGENLYMLRSDNSQYPRHYYCEITSIDVPFAYCSTAPTAAEAIARAWWAWKAGQDD